MFYTIFGNQAIQSCVRKRKNVKLSEELVGIHKSTIDIQSCMNYSGIKILNHAIESLGNDGGRAEIYSYCNGGKELIRIYVWLIYN